jgi:two-component system phosphate regulon sensor histidine kinase PhoR
VKRRIFAKLFLAFALVIAITTAVLDLSFRHSLEGPLREEIQRNLTQKTRLFALRVENDRVHSSQEIVNEVAQAAGARATIVDATGKVLADSEADPATMENHATRKEFAAALAGAVGSDERRSHTLGIPFLYVAAPISGGAVRLAYPLAELQASMATVRRQLIYSSVLALAVSLVIAFLAAFYSARRLRRIVSFADRIADGDLTARISESAPDEIGQVADALNRTALKLQEGFAALQTSQHRLETLLNSMQDAVIAVSDDGRVLWANQGMDRLVPQKTRLSAPIVESVRDPDFLAAVQEAAETRKVTTARAASIVPGHTFDVTAAPMPEGGAVAVLRDLTERERVEKTRRDFIANVSHELRTPLTSIQGYTETLLDSAPQNDHAREFLEIIRKNAARMSRLTEDLLTLARVESGEHRFDLQFVTPDELLQDAVESFRELARAQGIELSVAECAPDAVFADREAMHQVFSNLIENALKYASSGKRIVLAARTTPAGVEFSVRDYGPGISSEHVPRLFERFYRVDKARSRESGGTGLGLAIAKHIVLAHHGTIRAESELNHGSAFLFTLPLAPEDLSAGLDAASPATIG